MSVSLDFSANSTAQKHWKGSLYRQREHASARSISWTTGHIPLHAKYTLMLTWLVLTSGPGEPSASKQNHCLFRGGFYSSTYGSPTAKWLSVLTSVSLDFSANSTAQKHWKGSLYRQREHTNARSISWTTGHTPLYAKYTLMLTSLVLTSEPGEPLAPKQDQRSLLFKHIRAMYILRLTCDNCTFSPHILTPPSPPHTHTHMA